jgi:thiamine-phosphate pyrophosphorylase
MTHFYLGGICFITGIHPSLGMREQAEAVLDAGIRCIQLRQKDASRKEIYETAVVLRSLTSRYDASLIVNDHADIALACDADGVHLGQEDLPLQFARKIMSNKIVGISTHSIDEALAAQQGGADYIGFGPIFPTRTKDAGGPRGLEELSHIREKIKVPVMAIGGITADSVKGVMEAGADAAAVSGAVLEGGVFENARRFAEFLKNCSRRL